MKTRSLIHTALLSLCLLCAAASAAAAAEPLKLAVEPRTIRIDARYDGTTLTASGTIPESTEAILRFIGASCDLHMKERGKVLGIMWMNLNSLTFHGVPNVCLVSSAADLDTIGSVSESGKSAVRAYRLTGIGAAAELEPKTENHEGLIREFLDMKRHEGLYRESIGSVTYGEPSDGWKTFKAEIPIPSRLTPGNYMVELAAVGKDGVVSEARQPVDAILVGFPALLSKLAFDHSALYGILATLIAIASGLGIGLVFQSKGAH